MKWKTLQHNGILFPPFFESLRIKLTIKGENVPLDLSQEEMVYQWAKKKDTPYAQDKIFQKNFTLDFAKTLPSKFKKISYEDLDFSNAYKLVDKEKDIKEMMTKEEKKVLAVKRKELREELKEKFGKAIIDGKEVEVGNYMAEPPGIFMDFKKLVLITPGSIRVILIPNIPSSYRKHSLSPSNANFVLI